MEYHAAIQKNEENPMGLGHALQRVKSKIQKSTCDMISVCEKSNGQETPPEIGPGVTLPACI